MKSPSTPLVSLPLGGDKMPFEIPKTAYSGKIREVTLGKGAKAITVGGETAYPFHLFEGQMPHLPRFAMEVYDMPPDDWPEAARRTFCRRYQQSGCLGAKVR